MLNGNVGSSLCVIQEPAAKEDRIAIVPSVAVNEPARRVNPVETFPNGGFRALWAAIGVSQAGSAVSLVAIPLIAAITLHAGPGQMAWLTAMTVAPGLLVSVPAAAWSDSLHGRRVSFMIVCNLLQAVVIALVPLLWRLGALGPGTLLMLVGAASLGRGVYSSLSGPVLVQVVPRPHLVDANGKIAATRSVADIGGPAFGGALLAIVAAPLVVLADAASFLCSAILLTRIRPSPRDEQVSSAAQAPRPRTSTAPDPAGLVRLAAAMARRSPMQAMVVVAFVNGVEQTVVVLFIVRELHLRPAVIGLLFSLGAVGGVGAGLLVGRILRRFGPGPTLAAGMVATMCSLAVLPFATAGASGAAGVVVLELAGSFGGTLMIATVFGRLQGAAPDGKIAQVTAVAGAFLQVAALAGAPAGGALATWLGLRTTILVAFGFLILTLTPQLIRWAIAHWNIEETENR